MGKNDSSNDFLRLISPYRDRLVIITIFLYSFIIWYPSRNLPYFWDSAGYIINSARQIFDVNFGSLVTDFSAYSHPPLLQILLALSWKLFGQTIQVSHILMFFFLPILLTSTYFLGKKAGNWQVGLAAAVVVATIPVVLSEYGIIYVDLPEAALITAALTLWVYKKYWQASILLTLGLLMKFIGLIIIPVMLAYMVFQPKKDRKLHYSLSLLLPIFMLALWFWYHFSQTGWWLVKPGVMERFPERNLEYYLQLIKYIITTMFWRQGSWLMTTFGMTALIYLVSVKKLKTIILNPLHQSLILYVLGTIGFFLIATEFFIRYIIFIFPVISIIWLSLIFKALGDKRYFYLTVMFIASAYIFNWHPKIPPTTIYEFAPPTNMAYKDMIALGEKTAKFISGKYSDATVYGSFPQSYELTQPHQGYISKPVKFAECDKFTIDPDSTQILVIHPYAPMQIACAQLANQISTTYLARFEENGKWAVVLQVNEINASQSANLQKSSLP